MAKTNVQYGSSIPASDVANILQQTDRQANGVQTWRQLFGNAALGYQSNLGALEKDFSDAISQAYSSNLAQQGVIASSGLAAGSRNYLQENLSKELSSVYQNYVNNYRKAQQEAQQSYSDEYNLIAKELGTRAENISSLYNDAAYGYLSYLNEQGKLEDLNLGWLNAYNDETGELNMLNKDTMMEMLFDKETGEMNAYGRAFYDAMFNMKGDTFSSFGAWLAENNPELADWALDADVYNTGGTNLDKVKDIIGVGGDYVSDAPRYIETRNVIGIDNTYTSKTKIDKKGNPVVFEFGLADTDYIKGKKTYYNKDKDGNFESVSKVTNDMNKWLEKVDNKLKLLNEDEGMKWIKEKITLATNSKRPYLDNLIEKINNLDVMLSEILGTDYDAFANGNSDLEALREMKGIIQKTLNIYRGGDTFKNTAEGKQLMSDIREIDNFEAIYNNIIKNFKSFGTEYHKQLVEQKDKDRNK